MRLGLASDTYGNVDALAAVLERFVAAKVDRILFLGGRYGDVDVAVGKVRFASAAVAVAAAQGATPGADPFLAAFRGALAAQVDGGAQERERLRKRIVRVVSRACPEYEGGSAPRKLMELVEGHVACLVHDKAELTRDDITNAEILFHGNSARAAVVAIGPRIFVTPGHLREPPPEGRPPSYALVEVEPRALTLVVHGLDGAELHRERVEIGPRSKMVVR